MSNFNFNISLIEKLMRAMVYADLLQKMLYKNRAYEKNKGETQKLFDTWIEKVYNTYFEAEQNRIKIRKNLKHIVLQYAL